WEMRACDAVGSRRGTFARSRRCSGPSAWSGWRTGRPGWGNLHPADAALNLPVERHSHGLRKLAALEAPRGSFDDAVEAILRQTGQRLGKRQVQELASLAAMDFEGFYEARRPVRAKSGDLLVL